VVAVLGLCSACGDENGGSGGAGGNGLSDAERACQLADASMVTAAFGVTASEGVPGIARNCEFDTPGGEAESVNVFYFGDDSGWEAIRNGYEMNRGGTTDVPGVGEDAFYPNDMGPTELVVRANGIIFVVSAFVFLSEPSAALAADVAELAQAIAES
jgi:hypothetical protein